MNGLKRRIGRLERAARANQEGKQLRVIIRLHGETTEQCLSRNKIPDDCADLTVIIAKFSSGEPDYLVNQHPAATEPK